MNEKAIERLVKMYNEIENDLLLEIVSHFSINEEFLNSDYWRMSKLEEMGLFNRNIIRYIAKKTKKTNKEILKALNKIGIDTINIGKYNKLYSDGTIKVEPSILKNNYTIQNIITKTYNELSNEFIELSNKIEQGARKAYLNIVESAYLKTSMGTHSYQQAIRQSIDELSNKGIETLTYVLTDENNSPKGIRNYTIEGAARREILTSTRKLSNAINLEVANQLECEYLYLSEHLRCRPTHFDWQGTIIKREDLVKVTHYGDVAGLGGPNCSHYVEPYFGDARGNDLKKFSKDECEKAYNLSQYQRYLERGIRKWKRKEEMFKASDDKVAYIKSHNKRLEWQKRIQDFTNENKLRRDFTREYVKENQNSKLEKEYRELVKEANLNYNIGTQEENVQRCLKAKKIQEEIKSKEHLINENKQRKHNVVNDSDSYFYISLEEEQQLVNKHAGNGIITFTKNGQWNNKEIVSTNKIIGKYINQKYGTTADTNSFVIHYSKKGVHIVPARNRK